MQILLGVSAKKIEEIKSWRIEMKIIGIIDPIDPEGGNANSPSGKKKQVAPWHKFCFRLSNYTIVDINNLISSDSSIVPTIAFQEEGGPTTTEETPHLQGFGMWAKGVKRRPVGWWEKQMGHKRMHFEKMKGSIAQNMKYCTREFHEGRPNDRKRQKDGRVYTRGCPRLVVKMTYGHLTEQQKAIADKYKEFEDPLFGRQIHWYWEPQGEWGKTKLQKYMIDNMKATMVGGKKADMFYALSELMIETGEVPPIVIINLVKDTDMQYVSYAGMESIKDGCFFSKKFKSGMCRFNSPHLLIFANEAPQMDRFTRGVSKHRCEVFPLTEEAEKDWAFD